MGTLDFYCYDSISQRNNGAFRRIAGADFRVNGVTQPGYKLTHRCLLRAFDFDIFVIPVHVNGKHWSVAVSMSF